ncbi:MAG: CapA family protein [Clostridia bacterium]|nr:CapA family protein [Clostridia bacterium]
MNNKKNKGSNILKNIAFSVLLICILVAAVALVLTSKNSGNSDSGNMTAEGAGATNNSEENQKDSGKIKVVSTANILSTGDVLIHEPILNAASNGDGTYDFSRSFTYVKSAVSSADFAVCNLEVTLGGADKNYSSYPLFNSPDYLADAIKNAGFDLVLIANNHSYDTGLTGIKRTQQVVSEKGLDFTGSRVNATDKPYYIKEIKGIKIGFLNYTYETPSDESGRKALNGNFLATEATDLINTFNYDKLDEFYSDVKTNITAMKKDGAQAIMLYLHWGTEYQTTPNDYQKTIAKNMCDLGVDVLIGGHPHVVQPVEIINSETTGNQMVCLYSMGNALSNQRIAFMGLKTGHTEDGILFYTTFTKYSSGEVKLTKIDYIPTWVNIAMIDSKKIHQIIPLDNIMNWTDGLGLTAQTATSAKKSYERTKSLVGSGIDAFNQSVSGEAQVAQKQAE